MAGDIDLYDVIIIGAGPAGLACAIDAHKNGLSYLVLEKGCLVNSIFKFPPNLVFFSTADLLEIGNVPFIVAGEKPTRADILKYYRLVSRHFGLNIQLFEEVGSVSGQKDDFSLETSKGRYKTRNVVIATGQYDRPNLLGIPGEHLPKVSHYYTEAHPFYGQKVAVIGGKNSAVEVALELYKHDVDVTIIHRGSGFGKSVKYWILPDIENRLKEGKIRAHFNTVVKEIRENELVLQNNEDRVWTIENDYVFALIGYHPDRDFFEAVGIDFTNGYTPVHDPNSLETNVPGIYIAGVITAGSDGSKVFIENSRNHGIKIIGNILNGKH